MAALALASAGGAAYIKGIRAHAPQILQSESNAGKDLVEALILFKDEPSLPLIAKYIATGGADRISIRSLESWPQPEIAVGLLTALKRKCFQPERRSSCGTSTHVDRKLAYARQVVPKEENEWEAEARNLDLAKAGVGLKDALDPDRIQLDVAAPLQTAELLQQDPSLSSPETILAVIRSRDPQYRTAVAAALEKERRRHAKPQVLGDLLIAADSLGLPIEPSDLEVAVQMADPLTLTSSPGLGPSP